MAAFLFKTEPTEYSFDDLVREKRCVWTGVSNPGALIHLRNVKKGDEVFIYHTGDQKAVVGLAKAASDAYEDPRKPGRNDKGEPKFAVVDLTPLRAAKTPIKLAEIKADVRFAEFPLVRQGRLSAMAVSLELAQALRELGRLQ